MKSDALTSIFTDFSAIWVSIESKCFFLKIERCDDSDTVLSISSDLDIERGWER